MYEYNARVTRVVDGDTYEVTIDLGFRIFKHKTRLRLRGIDTPETWRPRSHSEALHGEQATMFVEDVVETNSDVRVITYKHGPSSFARYEADVYCRDAEGNEFSLAEALKEAGMEKLDRYHDEE